ncbi:MAG TPA: bifunctional phosphoglucose/phosphomannose isomerase [Chitinophagales bacterium]
MIKYITEFPNHLTLALEDAKKIAFHNDYTAISNVVFAGLGGSGFISNLASDLTKKDIKVPIFSVKDYSLPEFVDESSLVVLVSYSGNTEEVISCLFEALGKGIKPIAISSGGKLKELALKYNLDFVEMPQGFPPRASLGYGAVNALSVLQKLDLILLDVEEEISAVAKFLLAKQESINNTTKIEAKKLKNKLTIAYNENAIDSVGLRLQQQIDENSKSLCFHNAVSEMNHNEIVGWRQKQHDLGVIFLRHSFEHERNKLRFNFVKDVVKEYAKEIIEVFAEGENFIQQYFYLIHWSDFLSYHLGIEHGADTIEVNVIDKLKNYLSNTK